MIILPNQHFKKRLPQVLNHSKHSLGRLAQQESLERQEGKGLKDRQETKEAKVPKGQRVEAGVCGGSTKTVEVIVVGEVGGELHARLHPQEIEGLQPNLGEEEEVGQALAHLLYPNRF